MNEWIPQMKIPKPHEVSGKSITIRMAVFLTQMIPGISQDIKTEEGRLFALYFIQKTTARLIQIAEQKKTPINTCLSFVEVSNVKCFEIINKELRND